MTSASYEKWPAAFTHRTLCTRCGTCVGICPTHALKLDEDLYPNLDPDKCTECGLCVEICPGACVSFKDLAAATFGKRVELDTSFDGRVTYAFMAYAADRTVRETGSGGGVVTALLWDRLKHNKVDGCVVTRQRKDKPWIGEYFIARTYEDLVQSQGSRYVVIPINAAFQAIQRLPGRYAYVGLPCHIHGYRLASRQNEELKEKIDVVIGLFCGGALEPYMVTELLKTRNIDPNELKDFQFRGGTWPGKIRAISRKGEITDLHYSNYKDGAYNYFTAMYMPKRCQTCVDGSAEFSDLSISDAWTKDKSGNYKYKAHSRILVRTQKGLEIVENACRNGTLVAQDVSDDEDYQTHQIQTKRKRVSAPLRIERLRRRGEPAPHYDRSIPETCLKEKLGNDSSPPCFGSASTAPSDCSL